jgi:hypothetical protein
MTVVGSVQADVFFTYDGTGTDYVTATTTFTGGALRSWTGNETNRWDPGTANSYDSTDNGTAAGPEFFGAFNIDQVTAGVALHRLRINDVTGLMDFQFRRNSGTPGAGETIDWAMFMLFKKDQFTAGFNTNPVALDALTIGYDLQVEAHDSIIRVRGLVWDEDGSFYMSSDSVSGSDGTLTLDMPTTTWIPYDPSTDAGIINDASGPASLMTFDNILGIGYYASAFDVTDDGAPNANRGQFGITGFSAEGTIPEPGTVILVAGVLAGAALRRRLPRPRLSA